MQLNFKSKVQSEENAARDGIYACMETGNHGEARNRLVNLVDTHPELAETLRVDVISEYGISL